MAPTIASEQADMDAIVQEAVMHLRAAVLLLDRVRLSQAAIYVCHALAALGVPAPLPSAEADQRYIG
jgi:hypothetical protein